MCRTRLLESRPHGRRQCRRRKATAQEEKTIGAIDQKKVNEILDRVIQYELSETVRFTHHVLMVTGPNRLPIESFLQGNAADVLTHVQQAGVIMTGLGGLPSMATAEAAETNDHSVQTLLGESHACEIKSVEQSSELLSGVAGTGVHLEEYARGTDAAKEAGVMEFRKMLRDFGDSTRHQDLDSLALVHEDRDCLAGCWRSPGGTLP